MAGVKNSNESIQVSVRCRPLLNSEKHLPTVIEVHPEVNKIIAFNKSAVKTYTYDKVFGSETTQVEIYNNVAAPLIQEVIKGFNCTILAYGQTGTGKTFTIEGNRHFELNDNDEQPMAGIIPRSMQQIFHELTAEKCNFEVGVSFLELYNEEIFDLLSKSDELSKLRLYDNAASKGSVFIQGLEVRTVQCMQDVYDVLNTGCKKRRKAATHLNKLSSRSHTVFTVTVSMQQMYTTMEKKKTGKLNLVDLAGSENIGRSGAVERRAREAGSINQSLLSLGRVITALCENAVHVPYRESKLTRLLRDSLGGQTKTSVIATISPSAFHLEETLNTLEYALRAKNITNKPEVNSEVSATALTKDYLERICNLREEMEELSSTRDFQVHPDNLKYLELAQAEKSKEMQEKLILKAELMKESLELDEQIVEAEKILLLNELKRNKIVSHQDELGKRLSKGKEEIRVEEMMHSELEAMISIMHEKVHKGLKEKESSTEEVRKMEAKTTEVLNENRYLQRNFSKMCQSRDDSNQILREFKDRLLKKATDIQKRLIYEKAECERYLSMIENGFDSFIKKYEEFCKLNVTNDLEKMKNEFYNTLVAAFQEEENKIREFQSEIESNITPFNSLAKDSCIFEPLSDILSNCKANLQSLISSLTDWSNELTQLMMNQDQLLNGYLLAEEQNMQTLADSCEEVKCKQQKRLDEYSNIIMEALLQTSSKKQWENQLNKIQDAVESFQISFLENISDDLHKSTLACDKLRELADGEINNAEKILAFCESSTHSTEELKNGMLFSLSGDLSSKIYDMKKSTNKALLNYKDLFPDFRSCVDETKSLDEFSKAMEERVADDKTRRNELQTITSCIQNFKEYLMLKDKSNNMVYSEYQIDLTSTENLQTEAQQNVQDSFKQLHKTFSSGISENINDIETNNMPVFLLKETSTNKNYNSDGSTSLLSVEDCSGNVDISSTLNATFILPEESSSIENETCFICENKENSNPSKADSGGCVNNFGSQVKPLKASKNKKVTFPSDQTEKLCSDFLDNNWNNNSSGNEN